MKLDVKEWVIIGAVGLGLFGLYSFQYTTSVTAPLFKVSDSYQMIRPTEYSNSFDISGRRVVRHSRENLQRQPQQKPPVAKVEAKKEDPKKVAEDKKKQEEAKKKALAEKNKKAQLQVLVTGGKPTATLSGGDQVEPVSNQNLQYVQSNKELPQTPDEQVPDDKVAKKKKTEAEWEKVLFGANLTPQMAGDLVEAHRKGDLSDGDFAKLVAKMLRDQSHGGDRQKAALIILKADGSFASFVVASQYEKEISEGDALREKLKDVFASFNTQGRLSVLATALNSKDASVRAKSMDLVAEVVKSLMTNQTAQTPRVPAGAISLSSLNLFLTPLTNIAKGSDQDLARLAQTLTQDIHSLHG